MYDFPSDSKGRATPYGIYDQAANHALVMVGIGVCTAAFAVASIRRWWEKYGCQQFPVASEVFCFSVKNAAITAGVS